MLRNARPRAAALRDAKAADATLSDLFATVRPAAGFEQRMIESLRHGKPPRVRRMLHPMIRRVAVGLAASILLGAVGLVGQGSAENAEWNGAQPHRSVARNDKIQSKATAKSLVADAQ